MIEALELTQTVEERNEHISSPLSLLVGQKQTCYLNQRQGKEVFRLMKHLSGDICRTASHAAPPPSWLLKLLIEQCGVREYDSVNWRSGILLIAELIEEKLLLEKQGLPQFLDSENQAIFKNISRYSVNETLAFFRAMIVYLRELNAALVRQLRM